MSKPPKIDMGGGSLPNNEIRQPDLPAGESRHGSLPATPPTAEDTLIARLDKWLALEQWERHLEMAPDDAESLICEARAALVAQQAEIAAKEATIMAVVHTIGGCVEGAQTHRGNFLQRVRELVKAEIQLQGTVARMIEENHKIVDAASVVNAQLRAAQEERDAANTQRDIAIGRMQKAEAESIHPEQLRAAEARVQALDNEKAQIADAWKTTSANFSTLYQQKKATDEALARLERWISENKTRPIEWTAEELFNRNGEYVNAHDLVRELRALRAGEGRP